MFFIYCRYFFIHYAYSIILTVEKNIRSIWSCFFGGHYLQSIKCCWRLIQSHWAAGVIWVPGAGCCRLLNRRLTCLSLQMDTCHFQNGHFVWLSVFSWMHPWFVCFWTIQPHKMALAALWFRCVPLWFLPPRSSQDVHSEAGHRGWHSEPRARCLAAEAMASG